MRPIFFLTIVFSTCLGCALFTLNAAAAPVEVVEGRPDVVKQRGSQSREYSAGGNSALNGELFMTIQQLQAEVRELRGVVEEQTHLIEQLRKRRLDDYIDLDKRIRDLQNGVSVSAGNGVAAVANKKATVKPSANKPANVAKTAASARPAPAPAKSVPPARTAAVADTARIAYRSAYQKVKDRQFDKAKVSLTAFVSDFPDSQYVPNAEFWLGELYYLDSNLEKARDAFYILVTQYSNHRKVPDAKFKLGKIYHQLGDREQARLMLQSVLSDHPDSKAANPAREYLKNSLD